MFSVITATHNAAATLPRLLDSLAAQTCRDFELIIQDGASTDNTVAVAESYRNKLPALSLASEPDMGIYDAWNRAVKRSSGQWLLFLGGDDYLTSDSILHQVKLSIGQNNSNFYFISTEITIIDFVGHELTHLKHIPGEQWKKNSTMPAPFPGLFIRSCLCHKIPFDTSFRIAADKLFLYHTWQEDIALPLPLTSVHMLSGGISSQPELYALRRWEAIRIFWKCKIHNLPYRLKISIKTGIFYAFFIFFGYSRGLKYINKIRRMRGLPPYIIDTPNH